MIIGSVDKTAETQVKISNAGHLGMWYDKNRIVRR